MKLLILSILLLFITTGCAPKKTSASGDFYDNENQASYDPFKPVSIRDLASGKQKPPTSDSVGEQFSKLGESWLYGPGFGKTILNVGTTILFPPYGIYLLGNAGLALAGYEQVEITRALPEFPREGVLMVYEGVASVPGRIAATVAGKEYAEGYSGPEPKVNNNIKTLSSN